VQLLVSVRDAVEARAALDGGAGIIDAKEPAAGALGPVSGATLTAIRTVVPAAVPLSAALGDVATAQQVERAFLPVLVPLSFVKLGFLGVDDAPTIRRLLALAVERCALLPSAPRVVAVAYADWRETRSLPPSAWPDLLEGTDAGGLLVDTVRKDGGTLRDLMSATELAQLGHRLGRAGRRYAVAGGLQSGDVALVRAAGGQVLGVRGAVCRGGRAGTIDPEMVRRFATVLERERAGEASATAIREVMR
jgi:uncharacterized protein (UPF0264 family)